MLIHHRHWLLVALLIAASSGTLLFCASDMCRI